MRTAKRVTSEAKRSIVESISEAIMLIALVLSVAVSFSNISRIATATEAVVTRRRSLASRLDTGV